MAKLLFSQLVSSPDEAVACAALDTLCTLMGGADGEPASGALAEPQAVCMAAALCVYLVGPLAQAACPASCRAALWTIPLAEPVLKQ